MADDDTVTIEAQSDAGSANPMPTSGAATINAPQFDEAGNELKLEAKSISTTAQAWQICTTLEQNNRQRALRTAQIQAIHDGEPPKSAGAQAEKAKSWESNFSTQWLAGIVGRQAQRFVNAIIQQIYLTYSRLPDSYPDAKSKSDFMQAKFTRLVRCQPTYTTTINTLAVENVLQGYTYAVFLDPITSKPRMFKQDRLFLPELAPMHANELQFFCCKEDYRLDQFLDLISDEEAAKDAGYDLDNCMTAANTATMQDPREDATTTQYRKWADMINEGTLGLSYSNTGERVVKVWLLFYREYDGSVSFYMIQRDNGLKLRFSFKLFKKMEDVLVMFSFEPGNGCIHSSKGLGRKLAALAMVKELFRCGIVDLARVQMLLVVMTDAKDRNKMAPQLMSPFIYMDKSNAISVTQFPGNAQDAKVVDQLIDNWAEQAVGAFLASQTQDRTPDKTATQVNIEAKREQEAADIQLRRWLDQYFSLTQAQQIRAFSDENIDRAEGIAEKIAKDPTEDKPEIYEGFEGTEPEILRTLVEILRGPYDIDGDQIKVWRSTPASVFAHVSDAVIQQGIEAVYAQFKGDPNVNQPKLIQKVIEGRVGADDASELVIPSADQTVVSEASNLQYMEATAMQANGFPIKASARDNHLVHGAVCQDLLTKLAPILSAMVKPDPHQMLTTQLIYNHLGQHLEFAAQGIDAKNPAFIELEKFWKGFGKQLRQVIQIQQQAAAASAVVHAQVASERGLLPVVGQPGGVQAPLGAPGAPPTAAAPFTPIAQPQPAPVQAAA